VATAASSSSFFSSLAHNQVATMMMMMMPWELRKVCETILAASSSYSTTHPSPNSLHCISLIEFSLPTNNELFVIAQSLKRLSLSFSTVETSVMWVKMMRLSHHHDHARCANFEICLVASCTIFKVSSVQPKEGERQFSRSLLAISVYPALRSKKSPFILNWLRFKP
jgi:hypothetical protein